MALLPALAFLVALPLGCSSGPDVDDVRLTYVRKASERHEPLRETFFNASHSEFQEYRNPALRGTMPTPGRDGEQVELRSWPIDGLPSELDWPEDIPEDLLDRLDYLPPERVVPAQLPEEQREEWLREETGMLTWIGAMSEVQRDELLAISNDPEWQRAIFALSQESPDEDEWMSGAAVIQAGYNVLMLPQNTFPADDEDMWVVPEAYDHAGFFRYGLAARDEDHALQAFYRSPNSVTQALILTVDGNTTVWMTPQRHANMSEREFKRKYEGFIKCLRVYFEVLRAFYRPPEVFDEDRRDVFLEEQERLREQRERRLRELGAEGDEVLPAPR